MAEAIRDQECTLNVRWLQLLLGLSLSLSLSTSLRLYFAPCAAAATA
jgi:hypothetical protein